MKKNRIYLKMMLFLTIALLSFIGECHAKEYSYSEYLDKIGDGFSCSYKPSYTSGTYSDISNITIKATKDGIRISYSYVKDSNTTYGTSFDYVTINGNSLKVNNGKHSVGDYKLTYKKFSYKNYLTSYVLRANSCQSHIYITGNGEVYDFSESSEWKTFESDTPTSGGSGTSTSPACKNVDSTICNCKNTNATICKTYNVKTYLDGDTTIELGRQQMTNNGTPYLGKYFYIYNQKGVQIIYSYNQTADSQPAYVGSYSYIIRQPDWNNLFKDDSTFASEVIIDEKNIVGANVAHITTSGSQTISDYAAFSSVKDATPAASDPNISIGGNGTTTEYLDVKDCKSIIGTAGSKILNDIFNLIKYIAPILVAIFSTIDLIKAAVSGNKDDMKPVYQKFIKRIIAAVLLFFIVSILNLVLGLFGIATPADCFK